ncbi:MAG: hypothetical protein KKB59_01310 [Spirochaetes bacterium]|nr:hypothetical protein [Spirochaetota bacterium]
MEAGARLRAAGLDVRAAAAWPLELEDGVFRLASPAAGISVSAPFVRLGSMRPDGIVGFVYRPAQAGPVLVGRSGPPFAPASPADPSYLGVALGEDVGAFAAAPAAAGWLPDTERTACGVWISPRRGPFSILAATSEAMPRPGGPSWYDVPRPPASRVFIAASAAAAGSSWTAAAAAAASAGYPGPDAVACRAEAGLSLGRLRLEAEGSVASDEWRGPDAAGAPFLRLSADLRAAKNGYSASLGYRFVRERYAPDPSGEAGGEGSLEGRSTIRGKAEGYGRLGLARVTANLSPRSATRSSTAELDTLLRPSWPSWLTVTSSWRAIDGESTRFDATATAAFGSRARAAFMAGLRFVPEGRLVRASVSASIPLGRLVASCSIRTAGWIEPADDWPRSLEFAVGASATFP